LEGIKGLGLAQASSMYSRMLRDSQSSLRIHPLLLHPVHKKRFTDEEGKALYSRLHGKAIAGGEVLGRIKPPLSSKKSMNDSGKGWRMVLMETL